MVRSRGRRVAVLLTLAGAAITALAVIQTWATGSLADPVLGRHAVPVAGTAAAPALLLLVAVAVAGLLASLIGGRLLRVACGVAMALAGGAVTVFAARAGADPGAALASPAAAVTGRTGAPLTDVAATGWPWVAVVGGAFLLLAGLLVIRGGAAWGGGARRFERAPTTTQPAVGPPPMDDPAPRAEHGAAPTPPARDRVDDWERLSRDEDPTT